LVEQAIRAGKIPESRRALYLKKMQKRPRATAKLLDKLAPALEPSDELSSSTGRTARAEAESPGPTDYPKGWLRPGEGDGSTGGGQITFEDDRTRAGALVSPGL
jgi:hypothetical protein